MARNIEILQYQSTDYEWHPVNLRSIIHDLFDIVIGGSFKILVDGEEVYSEGPMTDSPRGVDGAPGSQPGDAYRGQPDRSGDAGTSALTSLIEDKGAPSK